MEGLQVISRAELDQLHLIGIYGYLRAQFGEQGTSWVRLCQVLLTLDDGRRCDKVVLRLSSGETRTLLFEVG